MPDLPKTITREVGADALLMTDSVMFVEQPIPNHARKVKFKLIRKALELQMPDWDKLVRVVDTHRPKTEDGNWEQWAEIEARVMVDHPHTSLDM